MSLPGMAAPCGVKGGVKDRPLSSGRPCDALGTTGRPTPHTAMTGRPRPVSQEWCAKKGADRVRCHYRLCVANRTQFVRFRRVAKAAANASNRNASNRNASDRSAAFESETYKWWMRPAKLERFETGMGRAIAYLTRNRPALMFYVMPLAGSEGRTRRSGCQRRVVIFTRARG